MKGNRNEKSGNPISSTQLRFTASAMKRSAQSKLTLLRQRFPRSKCRGFSNIIAELIEDASS